MIEKQKWQQLFESVEFTRSKSAEDVWTEERFVNFERKIGICFPKGYKEYCQIFGSGVFGDDFVRIYCPGDQVMAYRLKNAKEDLDLLKDYLKEEEFVAIHKLLDSAFPFGDTSIQWKIFWDLRSFNEVDGICNIYFGFEENYYLICNDFYQFINDFCLGRNSFDFPEAIKELYGEAISQEFSRLGSLKIEDV